jgi:hypothetical protein
MPRGLHKTEKGSTNFITAVVALKSRKEKELSEPKFIVNCYGPTHSDFPGAPKNYKSRPIRMYEWYVALARSRYEHFYVGFFAKRTTGPIREISSMNTTVDIPPAERSTCSLLQERHMEQFPGRQISAGLAIVFTSPQPLDYTYGVKTPKN